MRNSLRRRIRLDKLNLPRVSNKHNERSTIVGNADRIRYILRGSVGEYNPDRLPVAANGPLGSKV
jgi:hypothetical protein